MPKAVSPSGSFSDLYDAMQQRRPASGSPIPERSTSKPKADNPPGPTSPIEREGGKQGKREVGREGSFPTSSPAAIKPEPFDINERPYRKASFMLTNEEFWSLDEIKLDLQKRFDVVATKDDLARCAFRQLLAEYKRHGEASFLIGVLRKKTRR